METSRNYNEGCKHPGEYYVCKRLRVVGYLKENGFFPDQILPDRDNPRYNVYKYWNTPELENTVEEYFAQFKKN